MTRFKNTGNDHSYINLAFQCAPEAAEPPAAAGLKGLLHLVLVSQCPEGDVRQL